MIRFSCSGCKAVYEVDDSMANRSVDCGQCRRPMTVPEAPLPEAPMRGTGNSPSWLDDEERAARRNYMRPSYDSSEAPPPQQGVPGWVWFIVIIILVNIFLIPLTGHAIIPR